MDTSTNSRPTAVSVKIKKGRLAVQLLDGRLVETPLEWYPRLCDASEAQKKDWSFIAGGTGIHWPQLDEQLSVAGMLAGQPAVGYKPADVLEITPKLIKELREKLHLAQADLGKALGYSAVMIRKIESGERPINLRFKNACRNLLEKGAMHSSLAH